MGYCVVADIEGLNSARKQAFSDSPATTPSLTQVNGFITKIAGEIDAILSNKGITVPVTTNEYLKLMNTMGAAALAEASKNLDGTQEINASRDWRWKIYTGMLDDLKENPSLSGTVSITSGSRSDATANYSNANMVFKGDGRDW